MTLSHRFLLKPVKCRLILPSSSAAMRRKAINKMPGVRFLSDTASASSRIPRRFPYSSPRSSSAAAIRKAIKISGAPPSVATIPDESLLEPGSDAAAFVRQVGCTRRIFLLKPFMTQPEMEGLAYRIRTLTKNDSINSVLIATDDNDDSETGALPSTALDRDDDFFHDESADEGFPPEPGCTWFVSGGYDPLELYKSGDYRNPEAVDALLSSLGELAMANRGSAPKTKVPVITIPHGAIRDAGFAFCMSSYVMATRETSFRILNPSKGLSLDPVGLSYVLPRLGQEFNQPAKEYAVGCGMIVGLMGYEADAHDMMETGLATNYIDQSNSLGLLEFSLSEIPPWNQQACLKNPVRFYGERPPTTDHNAAFRNVAVADAVHCFSSYRADGTDMWIYSDANKYIYEDPSLDTDPVPWHEYRSSDLVDYAATFHEIFTAETTVAGILERFREIAARETNDPEEQEGIDVASDFVQRLERQSPLAVSVVHRLLTIGADDNETIRSCMEREKMVQAKMFSSSDFERWAKHAKTTRDDQMPDFTRWKHASLAEVSDDEVTEIVESMDR